ncbi:MAG: Activator of (R)-2-hydroxyglutaryl-CoA dehydratase, partial [Labilithrix sp.]|nr:Activator of (R)-2-hydroxyglutaryl-CoA dehydratase [Labilithrix sp.]
GTIFCPVETSGDGRVNFYSRVQMYLFKAKQAAIGEYERALTENGVTREQVQAFLDSSPKFRSPFYKAAHIYCGNNADLVAAVAPYITKTRGERWRARLTAFAKGSKAAVQKTPHLTVQIFQTAVEQAPVVAARVKEDLTMFRELRAEKKRSARKVEQTLDAAAEE